MSDLDPQALITGNLIRDIDRASLRSARSSDQQGASAQQGGSDRGRGQSGSDLQGRSDRGRRQSIGDVGRADLMRTVDLIGNLGRVGLISKVDLIGLVVFDCIRRYLKAEMATYVHQTLCFIGWIAPGGRAPKNKSSSQRQSGSGS